MNDNEDERHKGNIGALIAVALIVVVGVFLMLSLAANLKKERCMEEHRRYCDADSIPSP